MFRTFQIPISWTELVKRTMNEFSEDDVLGLSAQMAYYFLFALAPAIVFVIAIMSYLPFSSIQELIDSLSGFAPTAVVDILRDQLTNIAQGEHTGALTFGFLVALWSSSAAMVSVITALNRAYDIEDERPWWKVRLSAILLTIGVALFIILAFAFVVIGPTFIDRIASMVGLGPTFAAVWNIARWPIALALVALGVGLMYYFAPDADQDWEWITPGAVLATVVWLVASLGFKFYVANFADYNASYGSLGGVIILMLWFYISAMAILLGAEMNAEIEHASPHGKDPGEKVPGERRVLGQRAKREWERKQKEQESHPPPTPSDRRPAKEWAPLPRVGAVAYGVVALGLVRELRSQGRANEELRTKN
jgi:membrane protein